MSTHNDLKTATLDLLSELDLRQDSLLGELDSLIGRLDATLSEYVKNRSTKPLATGVSELTAEGCELLLPIDAMN